MKRILLLLLAATLFTASGNAIPAYPKPVTITQPDGSKLTLMLHGDEFFNYASTTDGYTVMQNESTGTWEYAVKNTDGSLRPGGTAACDAKERTSAQNMFLSGISKGMMPEQTPAQIRMRKEAAAMRHAPMMKLKTGQYDYSKFRGLVILVEYNDAPFTRSDILDVFTDMVNKKGYDGYMSNTLIPSKINCTGSVRDYYYENSWGLFDPKFDVYGPVKIDYSQFYANKSAAAQTLVTAALRAADEYIDYSLYDTDGNRQVDMVYFIFSGGGSNFSGNDSRLIWPHASQVMSLSLDGVSFGRYACSTELYGKPGNKQLDGIGTICHEFSHVLGLPDLYDTDYEQSGGQSVHPGKWSVMAQGPYLNMSRTPCGYSIYERHALGFAKPEIIDRADNFTLDALNTTNTGYKINSSVKNEFFLMENRQRTRWDEYLPGSGLLVYRVDSTATDVWENNKVNVNPQHNYYELLRATPKTSGTTVSDSDGDPFPGSGMVTELTNTTTPSLQSWAKIGTPIVIKDITDNGNGSISFRTEKNDIPILVENFEDMPVTTSDAHGMKGTFTEWSFTKGATVDAVEFENPDLGRRAAATVKSGEIISGTVGQEVESMSVTIYNASASSAIIRTYISHDGGTTWVSLKNLDGTTNLSIAAGTTTEQTYNLGTAKGIRFKFLQYSGHKTEKCYFDNIKLNCKPATTSIYTVRTQDGDFKISYTGGNSIDVYAGCADGTAVNAYSLQGITAATAHTAAGTATLHLPSPGIYIIRCGNITKRIVVEK